MPTAQFKKQIIRRQVFYLNLIFTSHPEVAIPLKLVVPSPVSGPLCFFPGLLLLEEWSCKHS